MFSVGNKPQKNGATPDYSRHPDRYGWSLPRDENSSPFARSGGAADATAAGRDLQVVSEEVAAGAMAAVRDSSNDAD
jgi:hypothetical protein